MCWDTLFTSRDEKLIMLILLFPESIQIVDDTTFIGRTNQLFLYLFVGLMCYECSKVLIKSYFLKSTSRRKPTAHVHTVLVIELELVSVKYYNK